MNLPVVRTRVRGQDNWGRGDFKAPRGTYTNGQPKLHKGIDIEAYPGYEVIACCVGDVTKIGFPYEQTEPGEGFKNEDERRRLYLKKAMRYVEVTTPGKNRVRHFYVDPSVKVGDRIIQGRTLGTVQDIAAIYPGITPHYHFEIYDRHGRIVNPYRFLEDQV
ncbi:MAG: M23 family metallopeptidase [Candidatus Thiodiazotropha taylori]|uniref:M23 family metallopeptidase n=1 Tax=Candidatus Thiodiazotropha taylori TaxID=2792791 RepID=A0A9E4N5T9_9GAMM|nr:M23 family metallopeptidase [Candidatus Thiodiazotropha taylori]MCW4258166.1 M23 family metallopeptidase [Candidatus Thiodiazotropha taylori]